MTKEKETSLSTSLIYGIEEDIIKYIETFDIPQHRKNEIANDIKEIITENVRNPGKSHN